MSKIDHHGFAQIAGLEEPGRIDLDLPMARSALGKAGDIASQLAEALAFFQPDHPAIPRAHRLTGWLKQAGVYRVQA